MKSRDLITKILDEAVPHHDPAEHFRSGQGVPVPSSPHDDVDHGVAEGPPEKPPSSPEIEAAAHKELGEILDSLDMFSEQYSEVSGLAVLSLSFEERIKASEVFDIIESTIGVARQYPELTVISTNEAAYWFPGTPSEVLAEVKKVWQPDVT
jgi:hypothetical protein